MRNLKINKILFINQRVVLNKMIRGKAGRNVFKEWVVSSDYHAVSTSLKNTQEYLKENPHIKYSWEDYLSSFVYRPRRTILNIAVETDDWKMVEILLDFGFNSKNLYFEYVSSNGDEIRREPLEIMLNRGINSFSKRNEARQDVWKIGHLYITIVADKFPDLIEKFDIPENYVKYPNQMLLAGIYSKNLIILKKALDQRRETLPRPYGVYGFEFYNIRNEEIYDMLLNYLSRDVIIDMLCDCFESPEVIHLPYIRSSIRHGYNLNTEYKGGYLLERIISDTRYQPDIPLEIFTEIYCDFIYGLYHGVITELIALGMDTSLNRFSVSGKLKDLLQPDVVSLKTLSLRSANNNGVTLLSIPVTLF